MAVRLPDSASLGPRRDYGPDRPIVGVRNAGAPYEAAEEAAVRSSQTFDKAADTLDRIGDAQTRLELARAKSQFLKATIEADDRFDNDKDHGTWEARYREQMGAIRESYGKNLPDAAREAFNNDADIHIARGAKELRNKADRRVKDEGRASTWSTVNQNIDLAMEAKDEETRAALMRSAGESITAAQDKGWYSAQEAANLRVDAERRYRADLKDRFATSLESELDKRRNELLNDPSKLGSAEADLMSRIDGSGLKEADKEKFRDKVKNGLGLSSVQSQIMRDPAKAKSALESGAWDTYLDADRKASALLSADAAIKNNLALAKSEASEKREKFTSDLTIGVHRGVKTHLDIEEAYRNGDITPATRTSLTNYLDKETERRQLVASEISRVQSAGDGGQPLDPKSKGDRDALNLHYDSAASQWKPEEAVGRSIQYSAQYGIVPEKFRSLIRGNLRSGNPEQALLASDTIARLRNLNPQLLNDFADEDLRLGNVVGSLTQAGIPPQQALNLAQDSLKVDKATFETRQRDYELVRGKTETERAQADKRWMEGKLNSIWSFDPTIDPLMHAEFNSLAQSEYVKTGNLDASRQFALDHVNRMWGRTEVGGDRRYMKWAPENFYGINNLSPKQNAEWMNEQLLQDVQKGAFVNPDNPLTKDRLVLMPDPTRTNQGRPVYQVSIKGEDGILHTVTDNGGRPLSWVPDWNSSDAKKRAEANTQKQIEDARQKRRNRNYPTVGPEIPSVDDSAIDPVPDIPGRMKLTPETASKSGVAVLR